MGLLVVPALASALAHLPVAEMMNLPAAGMMNLMHIPERCVPVMRMRMRNMRTTSTRMRRMRMRMRTRRTRIGDQRLWRWQGWG